MRKALAGMALAGILALGVIPSRAAAVPPPISRLCLSDCGVVSLVGPGKYNSAYGTATISYAPDPSVAVNVNAPAGVVSNTTSWASLVYSFELVGPSNVSVPVLASFNLSAGGAVAPGNPSFFYTSFASFAMGPSITSAIEGPNSVVACSDVNRGQCAVWLSEGINVVGTTFSGTVSASFPSNTVEEIQLYAQGQAGGATTNSLADPFIQIDPAFLASNPGFSLELSPGIGNPPPSTVPEPSSLALVAAGFATMGFIRRKGTGSTAVPFG